MSPTDVILTDYQEKMIHETINSCAHGLLLWWKMGTGKTIAAISLLSNYPNQSIIICPRNLHNTWKAELIKFGPLKNKISFIFYDELTKLFGMQTLKNIIVIFDEAHNLTNFINKSQNISKIIKLLKTAYKVFLLTGTPIDKDIADIVPLINIAANEEIVPYNNHKFKKLYFRDNIALGVMRGYLYEIARMGYMGMVGVPFAYASGLVVNPSFLPLFLFGTILTYFKYSWKNKVSDYRLLDKQKLSNDIYEYVNYYDSSYDKSYTENYPTTKFHKKYVEYSDYQVDVWYSLTQQTVSSEQLLKLDISSEDDVEYFSKTIDTETYYNRGVFIGNLDDKKFCDKFYDILDIAKGKRAVFYSSSLKAGSSLFMSFLEDKGISYIFLDNKITLKQMNSILDEFKNTTTFLILHPVYTEGITIKGAEQFHIIEPIWSFAKKQQVLARVARYGSHSHLPKDKRHVDIYEWICTSMDFIDTWKKQTDTWFKNNRVALWSIDYRSFDEFNTPDMEIIENEKILDTDNFAKIVMKRQIKKKVSCCIKFPSKKQDAQCMRTLKKRCSVKKCKTKKD